ncbi:MULTISPECIES: apolipoprotein N-acyltransferase [Colwellia]|uniref:Apolipoprotein N-acyltransferase n=1 Tax=Colwellia marinimaniae TaxID=1513592 RepID=A0ABQ0MSV8_9GAMM|nr:MULTISPECIES: apolipoprotein N-acyltransferase [Colwellia]GAW95302.1 apolipoprotein N-acyltransferase [Colwellia marinimaniae]
MTNITKGVIFSAILSKLTNKQNWLCFFSGFFLVFAYAPFSYWWLALILPSIILHQVSHASPKLAAKKMALFAFGWFSSGISWVHVSIDQFGGLPLIVSLLLMLALCSYLALFPALAGYLTALLSKNKQVNLWLLPSIWLFCEYLRSVVLTGFPWLSLGYSQIDSPLANFAPVIGEVGLTAIILLVNICWVKIYNILSALFKNKNQDTNTHISSKDLIFPMALAASILVTSLALSLVSWTELTGKSAKVALIQGNIAQSIKWQPEQEWPTMLKYLDLTRVNYDADLIVWPESAIPALEPAVQDFLSTVNRSAILNNSAVITGIINYNFESKEYYNALLVLGKKTTEDEQGYYYNHSNRYYKSHLLPIGEFIPFQEWLRPLAPLFNLPMSSFTAGNYVQPNLVANNFHILPLNCFEVAFPLQVAANFTDKTELLLTVSNDAWFGDSHGPHQHFEIARMRALEFGRPLIRSTNNGVTGIVNHLGEITAIAPQFVEVVLRGKIELVSGYTPYSQWPNLILFLMVFMPLVLLKLFKF